MYIRIKILTYSISDVLKPTGPYAKIGGERRESGGEAEKEK